MWVSFNIWIMRLCTQNGKLINFALNWSSHCTSRKMLFQKFWTTPTWEFAPPPLKMCNFQEFSTSRGRCSKCKARKTLTFLGSCRLYLPILISFPNFRSSYFVRKCDFWGTKVEDLFTHQNIFTYLITPPGDAEVRTSHTLLFLLNLA